MLFTIIFWWVPYRIATLCMVWRNPSVSFNMITRKVHPWTSFLKGPHVSLHHTMQQCTDLFKHLMHAFSGKKNRINTINSRIIIFVILFATIMNIWSMILMFFSIIHLIILIIIILHCQIYRAPKPILVSTLVQVRNDVANVLYAPTPAAWVLIGELRRSSHGKQWEGEVTSLTFDTYHES